ncbi:hypothetical protein AN958_08967 [Leucoagaricus sp. SymC.cos]|nr:hypothetical protein AN958_08967 [Leucoagaricus sp. SymC.cos]
MSNLTNFDVFERLDKNNAMLLIVDHQIGLFQLVRDYGPEEYKANILAHAAIGKAFNLPIILTTSAERGPNGPLPKEILEMYPDAPLIRRNGEVNAWDNAEFRKAVEATGKKQVIIGGIVTDMRKFLVFVNAEASGCSSKRVADDANARMRSAGAHILSTFAIVCELMRDWRNTPGSLELMPWFDKYYPAYGYLARAHLAAIQTGVIQPGEVSSGQ